jgi:hypothetical protein
MSRSKRYLEDATKIDIDKLYNLEDALDLIESSRVLILMNLLIWLSI